MHVFTPIYTEALTSLGPMLTQCTSTHTHTLNKRKMDYITVHVVYCRGWLTRESVYLWSQCSEQWQPAGCCCSENVSQICRPMQLIIEH